MRGLGQCVAVVGEPPYYARTHRCHFMAKTTVGNGHPVCGVHKRIADRWAAEYRLEEMIKFWWKQ